jgi:hypothetical protein
MRERYLKQIRSKMFINDLVNGFEKWSFYPFFRSAKTRITVGENIKDDPCGVGAGVGKLFELIIEEVCEKWKIPIKKIQTKTYDIIIDETPFEIKTTRIKPNGLIEFIGSGVKGEGHKKCGNYILIASDYNKDKIIKCEGLNKNLINKIFYSVNIGIIKTEHWVDGSGKTFTLKIPNSKIKRIQNSIIIGSAIKGKRKNNLTFLAESYKE